MKDKLLCLFVIVAFIGFLICRLSSLCQSPVEHSIKKVEPIEHLYKPEVRSTPLEEALPAPLPLVKTIDSRFVLERGESLKMEGIIPSGQKELLVVLSDFCQTFSCQNNISIEPLAKDEPWMRTLIPIMNEFSNQSIDNAKLVIENDAISLYGEVESQSIKQNIVESIDLYANELIINNQIMVKEVVVSPDAKEAIEQEITETNSTQVLTQNSSLSEEDKNTQEEINTFLSNHSILFKTGSSSLEKSSFETLDNVYAMLKKASSDVITIEGHTDSRGDENANRLLSQQRADTVKSYMVNKGIDESKLTAVGYGSESPLINEQNKEAYEKNRRVEFHLN